MRVREAALSGHELGEGRVAQGALDGFGDEDDVPCGRVWTEEREREREREIERRGGVCERKERWAGGLLRW